MAKSWLVSPAFIVGDRGPLCLVSCMTHSQGVMGDSWALRNQAGWQSRTGVMLGLGPLLALGKAFLIHPTLA